MEREGLAQDLEVVRVRLVEVQPEEAAACEQVRDRRPTEADLAVAAIVADLADRRAAARRRSSAPVRPFGA
jgi:hypothetical protein